MANSDYVIEGGGAFAATARLVGTMGYLEATVYYENYRANGFRPVAGDCLMIGNEICGLLTFEAGVMTVSRGCADTIPQTHVPGETIWFVKGAVGSNQRSYMEDDVIGVKPLPRTASKPALAIAGSPPKGLTMISRFARPYPPGNVLVNGAPWNEMEEGTGFDVSWAHRDRLLQQDQMVDHQAASIGPEAGTTYTLRIYNALFTELFYTQSGLTENYFNVTWSAIYAAFEGTYYLDDLNCFVTLHSVRDGLESMMGYTLACVIKQPHGFGYRFGTEFGGVAV